MELIIVLLFLPSIKNGHYGSIVGKGFDTMKEYHVLLKEAKNKGADFIKIMTTGLLDFNNHGQITGTPLDRKEVREMVHIAHEMDLFSSPYAFNPEEAVKMTKGRGGCGCGPLRLHRGRLYRSRDHHGAGCGSKGGSGKSTMPAVAERSDVIVLCHGGPISSPEDAAYVLQHTKGVHGFYGASSAERMRWRQPSSSISRNLRINKVLNFEVFA